MTDIIALGSHGHLLPDEHISHIPLPTDLVRNSEDQRAHTRYSINERDHTSDLPCKSRCQIEYRVSWPSLVFSNSIPPTSLGIKGGGRLGRHASPQRANSR